MNIEVHADAALCPALRSQIARYRHQVFAGLLGWQLPGAADGLDQDEFDVAPALHLLARAADGSLVGYGRLLPTTGPYLLARHFAELVAQGPVPCDARTWELSRFSAVDPAQPAGGPHTEVGKALLLAVVRQVRALGGTHIVCCTSVAIERVALRWGLRLQRLGVPMRRDREWLIGARIACHDDTERVLLPPRRTPPLRIQELPSAVCTPDGPARSLFVDPVERRVPWKPRPKPLSSPSRWPTFASKASASAAT